MSLTLKNKVWALLFFVLIIVVLKSCTPVSEKKTIRVAAAASTQYVLEALIEAYNSKEAVQIEAVISSSGKLTAQIEHGAPIDIFISADTVYPNYLFENGRGAAPPTIYAYGQLVLWTVGTYDLSHGVAVLIDSSIQKIAIADPKTAPYGRLSQAYLKEKNLYKRLEHKLILGESIGQVNQYINTEAVEIGLTAKSVVMAPKLKGTGQFVDLENTSLAQSMLLLKRGKNSTLAVGFYTFLQSTEAQKIFAEYGYSSGF
ncbi:MAG: Molybdenum ABC transporter, periplasmic molybdenum-binding protein ModA (TC 3.A.1.8.1) [uncultured Aureispira sp.]|uniref:Molybdenum ABC transporter, periplasmic molybdenum-binding protein ModA (TC 3.A.1.8.1) n=1 Tax=uncultured Aureispira sp. TaxID=1331704 RepID=A0A6S6UI02_9BACT|nr:MAG: Molybdenum ABC transporter, periplasmic molybdenum-binding protein ModA (TC 3.A.1.8.1) [uncultured Aureispira sp.]